MSLKYAVEAGLPIVSCTSRDTINLSDVLQEIFGKKTKLSQFKPNQTVPVAGAVYYFVFPPKSDIQLGLGTLYDQFTKAEATLLLVNPTIKDEFSHNAGEVPTPKTLIFKFLKQVVDTDAEAEKLMQALGGCTLKEIAELLRLTMAREGMLTVSSIMNTRRGFLIGTPGVKPISLDQDFYEPSQELIEWIEDEKEFFLHSDDKRLIPRGLLFDGPPGTGKTSGAKFVAREFGVPLFRFDVAGAKGKYVGQSEEQLEAAIAAIDREAPCVALIDELEKIFGDDHNDSGTTASMLGKLLWWMAEHQSRVLVVATTNKMAKLPPEMYREGRIDKVMWFGGLGIDDAIDFVKKVAATFDQLKNISDKEVTKIAEDAMKVSKIKSNTPTVSQSALTSAVYAYVKKQTKTAVKSSKETVKA